MCRILVGMTLDLYPLGHVGMGDNKVPNMKDEWN
jgi:hypothetical protein